MALQGLTCGFDRSILRSKELEWLTARVRGAGNFIERRSPVWSATRSTAKIGTGRYPKMKIRDGSESNFAGTPMR
jgi:hypothetical protein